MKLSPIKSWNMSEMHVYRSLYMCQDDGLRPLRSLDVFHAARFWGSCETATSESTTSANFNKQSLPISKPLSQTSSMIKRHTLGEPKGNLPFSFALCATLFVYFPLSSVFCLLIFSPDLEWEQYFAVSPPWFDFTESSTISCHDNLTLSYATVFHFRPRTEWPQSILYIANHALFSFFLFLRPSFFST